MSWKGRIDLSKADAPRFSWSHSGFAARFEGSKLDVCLHNDDAFLFRAVVDGKLQAPFQAKAGVGTYTVADHLGAGPHIVELYRETEGQYGTSTLLGLGGGKLAPATQSTRRIEVIGDSIAAGYGLLAEEHHAPELNDGCHYSYDTQSAMLAYPGLLAREFGAELSIVAHSGWGVVRDPKHDVTANVPSLYDRVLADRALPVWSGPGAAQFVLIHLGTNDFAGPPDSDPGEATFVSAYVDLLRRVREKHPEAWILCINGPLLTDESRPDIKALSASRAYIGRAIEQRTSQGDEKLEFIELPHADLSITACDWHPNQREHQKMAELLATAIRSHAAW